MISPELVTVVGGALATVIAAFKGGQTGGANSLNGFKEEVRQNFTSVHSKLDTLTRTDGEHEARLASIERIVERRVAAEPVIEERRG